MDRRSRFSPDPVLQSFRTRAVSQPPRSSGAPDYSIFAFPEAAEVGDGAQHRTAQSPVRDRPWGQRIGRSPAAVSRVPQVQLRSASFSATAHPPESEVWPPGGGRFHSTFEEDDEDSQDAWPDNFSDHTRSWGNPDSRFRSQIPGTRSRSLVPTHGLSATNINNGFATDWNDKSLSQSIDQRFLSGYPSNRINGSRAQSLQGTSSMPAALAQRGSYPEISNLSPFVRDRLGPRIDPDDLSGGYEHWTSSYMGTMREEETESGATSRRHSVSVVQPRVRDVGFAAPGGMDAPPAVGSRLIGASGRSMFSDEELAGDFSLLNVNSGGLHPKPEVHPSSFPYAVNRIGTQPYARTNPLNQGYTTTLDTHLPFNRTPSDGRSPIGDGNFPSGNPGGLDQLNAVLAKVSQPGNGHSLGPLRSTSRDPSPARNDGDRGFSPIHPNGNGYRHDPYQQHQQVDHGRNTSEAIQGVDLDHLPRQSRLVLLEFKLNRKEVFFCDATMDVKHGDRLIVEGDRGKDIGVVINPDVEKHWVLAQRQNGAADIGSTGNIKAKRAYAIAGPQEAQDLAKKEEDEQKALQLCQNKVRQKKLPMQVVDCEFQWDRRKLTFYFIAESRIDFRDLVRELFRLYKTRIWMSCVSGPLAGPTANIVY